MKNLPTRLLLSALLVTLAWITSGSASAALPDSAMEQAIARTCHEALGLPANGKIRVTGARAAQPDLLARAQGISRVELPPGESGRGRVTAKVHLVVPGQPNAWTWASARTEITVPTVITTRPIRRGERLQATDLMVTQLTENPSNIQRIEDAVGRVARRSIPRHKAVRATVVRKPDIIRRGDRLEAIIRKGSLRIRTGALAAESGGDADLIRVKLAENGRVLMGRVLNARQVEVQP